MAGSFYGKLQKFRRRKNCSSKKGQKVFKIAGQSHRSATSDGFSRCLTSGLRLGSFPAPLEHGPRFCQDFSHTGGKKPGRIQHQWSRMQSTGLPDGQEEAGLRQAHLRVSGSKLPIGLIRSLLQGTSSCQGLQSRSAY